MSPCAACLTGTVNAHHAVSHHYHRATRPLERLFLDFFIAGGEVGYDDVNVVLYVLDDATRYLWVHAAPTRTECVTWFLDNIPRFERHARASICDIVSDNGPEFLSLIFVMPS